MFKLGIGWKNLPWFTVFSACISVPRQVPQRYNAGLVIECNLVSKVTLIESQHTALKDLSAYWFWFKFLNEYCPRMGERITDGVWTENLKAGTHLQSLPHQGR